VIVGVKHFASSVSFIIHLRGAFSYCRAQKYNPLSWYISTSSLFIEANLRAFLRAPPTSTSKVELLKRRSRAHTQQIYNISGIAGASIGILYRGELIYTHYYGRQDVKANTKADNDTFGPAASPSLQQVWLS
jgi:hypothetical protein